MQQYEKENLIMHEVMVIRHGCRINNTIRHAVKLIIGQGELGGPKYF